MSFWGQCCCDFLEWCFWGQYFFGSILMWAFTTLQLALFHEIVWWHIVCYKIHHLIIKVFCFSKQQQQWNAKITRANLAVSYKLFKMSDEPYVACSKSLVSPFMSKIDLCLNYVIDCTQGDITYLWTDSTWNGTLCMIRKAALMGPSSL